MTATRRPAGKVKTSRKSLSTEDVICSELRADLFSAGPSVAEVSDAEEVRSTLRASRLRRRPPDPGGGLGLRGFQVEVLDAS